MSLLHCRPRSNDCTHGKIIATTPLATPTSSSSSTHLRRRTAGRHSSQIGTSQRTRLRSSHIQARKTRPHVNRLPWKASRGESGRATSDFTSPLVRIWLEISREFWPGVIPSVVTAGRIASGFTRTPHSREEGGASHSRLVRTFDFPALSRSSSSRASNPPRITDSEHLPAI